MRRSTPAGNRNCTLQRCRRWSADAIVCTASLETSLRNNGMPDFKHYWDAGTTSLRCWGSVS